MRVWTNTDQGMHGPTGRLGFGVWKLVELDQQNGVILKLEIYTVLSVQYFQLRTNIIEAGNLWNWTSGMVFF